MPQDLRSTKEHEWVRLEGDVATIGITDYAQGELGDIVFIEVDTVGESVGAEEVFGTIEAVKTVSDMYAPVAGEVLEFNESLEDEPEAVNSDPYGAGWIIKIRVDNPDDVADLLAHEAYGELIA